MNIRTIANRAIQAINRDQTVIWRRSTGYTRNGYERVPTYEDSTIKANIQALSTTDLQLTDAMNLSGIMRKVYARGHIEGVNRTDGLGGDILVFPETRGGAPKNWLVTQVTEPWNGTWCCLIVTLQVDEVSND